MELMQKEISREGNAQQIVTQHINAFFDNNLEGVLSDYTAASVLITQQETYTGIEAIRGFFSGMIPLFPKKTTEVVLEKMVTCDEVVFIVWHAKTPGVDVPFATDTFLVKEGKIHRQTFAGQLNFIKK